MKRLIGILLLITLLCGCRQIQYIPVETTKTEIVRSTDTIRQFDSIFVEKYRQSDTVFIKQLKYRYLYKTKTDTVVSVDSIPVVKTVEIEKIVEVVPKAYKWSMGICIAMITALLLALISKMRN